MPPLSLEMASVSFYKLLSRYYYSEGLGCMKFVGFGLISIGLAPVRRQKSITVGNGLL